jgi:hypothetical protein
VLISVRDTHYAPLCATVARACVQWLHKELARLPGCVRSPCWQGTGHQPGEHVVSLFHCFSVSAFQRFIVYCLSKYWFDILFDICMIYFEIGYFILFLWLLARLYDTFCHVFDSLLVLRLLPGKCLMLV